MDAGVVRKTTRHYIKESVLKEFLENKHNDTSTADGEDEESMFLHRSTLPAAGRVPSAVPQ